ncbi:MAG: MBL fold metallo-hydrolase [Deltaproteobacteria bacterium]|nr:MBL fold metallo-hydrolase [Deltaproteobacteria bacterium]
MTDEVSPGLFCIRIPLPQSPLKYLNSYVIKGADRNLVIDTGFNRQECLQAMREGLAELGVNLKRTDFFITHLHADHFGLVSKLTSDDSRVFFGKTEAKFVEAWRGWEPMIEYARRNGFPEDELQAAWNSHPGFKFGSEKLPELTVVNEGETFSLGGYDFTFIETPGHTMGHTCLYDQVKKILISGDHILGDITPNIQCWWDGEDPLKDYLASLDKVFELDVDLVLPGHRRLIGDCRARIKELKQHHHDRVEEVISILDAGRMNAFQVASEMSWDIKCESWGLFPVAQKWFATGEAIAHLRYLEGNGRVGRKMEGGAVYYFPIND